MTGQPATAPWPHGAFDPDALAARGWRPTALREFVLKVHQRCNLACDYCYVYTLADQSWRHRPAIMSSAVWTATARRISDHAAAHGLTEVAVVLHGGEPLLAGGGRLVAIADAVRAALPAGVRARIGMQTNGILLTDTVLARLDRAGIRIGVSLDGSAADHDTHRRRADGRGSSADVQRALLRLTGRYRSAFAGLLCTIDPDTDPVECYQALLAYEPPAMDFLLPHANWSTGTGTAPGRYGDWLVRLFDRWYGAPRKETRIRLFESVMSLVLGGPSRSEQVGLSPAATVVVESDGSIEQTDALKSAYDGAAATGLSVFTDPFDAVLRHPTIIARQIGLEALSDTCRACDIRRVCGGGHYAHRYSVERGFRNPSVYCADLQTLIRHVHARITTDLAVLPSGRSVVNANL